jgi:hypothetical protein
MIENNVHPVYTETIVNTALSINMADWNNTPLTEQKETV